MKKLISYNTPRSGGSGVRPMDLPIDTSWYGWLALRFLYSRFIHTDVGDMQAGRPTYTVVIDAVVSDDPLH